PKHREKGERDGVLLWPRTLLALQQQGDPERATLRRRETLQRLLAKARQQIAQSPKGEACLGAGRTAGKDANAADASRREPRLPERCLPDPRLAFEHQGAGAALHALEELDNRGMLSPPADQLFTHSHCPSKLLRQPWRPPSNPSIIATRARAVKSANARQF